MMRRDTLLMLLASPVAILAWRVRAGSSVTPVATGAPPDVDLIISTDGDLLAFKPDQLSCPSGSRVRLTFMHTGKYIRQQHDWVLTVPGAAAEVARSGEQAGEAAGFVPPGDRRVLAATPLCGKGEQAVVEFVAPAPGDYPFFCSYPGHDGFMRGVLHVTPPNHSQPAKARVP